MTQPFYFQTKLHGSLEQAETLISSILKSEGFGVLTRIDVKATLKEKLDAEFRPYVILGACNPPLAHRALQSDALIGMLLPCNIILEESENGVTVSVVNPMTMIDFKPFSENDEIASVAKEASDRLQQVIGNLETAEISGKV